MSLRLLSPVDIGPYRLRNRMVMAPLTRSRAAEGEVPTEMNALYYRQRASAGLIVSEGTIISPEGRGFTDTPGLFTGAQVEGWRKVTEAVHDAGGRIFAQLWHVGRQSHRDLQPDGGAPVAPSVVPAIGKCRTRGGLKDFSEPRALTIDEIARIVSDYRRAACNALEAGFDGVELHGANGYLVDQFLQDGANRRTDRYGGSLENRSRFLFEVLAALIETWGAGRVGLRLSPHNKHGEISDSDPWALHEYLARRLSGRGLAYLHVTEPRTLPGGYIREDEAANAAPRLRPLFDGPYIAAGGFGRNSAEELIAAGHADLVAFGRSFLANPDLPERFNRGLRLNPYDRKTFYSEGPRGYVDYPTWAESGDSADTAS
ncbi:alkene reductase [Oceanibacterium hippocampi]|uniref:N-ethylmaleimide reductase n=1 Tax=Oceanibacterium hippocampi TaxID=745714 RepID=A0A1Y5TTL1_9PROT|nr:alkene reductase [Oceanibacterium hippocampi]SLN71809.1 N-ethylmaleimide reductase [Oceanibacterium hippocampi]